MRRSGLICLARSSRTGLDMSHILFIFFQAEDGIRDDLVTGVQTCALPISDAPRETRQTALALEREQTLGRELGLEPLELASQRTDTGLLQMLDDELILTARLVHADAARSEERRVGKECRSRW